jgi:hypothetical protein
MKVYFAKDVTIPQLKLGGSCRPNYFLTFTLLETPPIITARLTYCRRSIFDIEKYGQPATTGSWCWFLTWRDFDI